MLKVISYFYELGNILLKLSICSISYVYNKLFYVELTRFTLFLYYYKLHNI